MNIISDFYLNYVQVFIKFTISITMIYVKILICIISWYTDFAEINEVIQSEERVIETLQLFPLNSFSETNSEKLRYLEYKENASSFSTYNNFGAYDDQMDHPTLDLRLSFL